MSSLPYVTAALVALSSAAACTADVAPADDAAEQDDGVAVAPDVVHDVAVHVLRGVDRASAFSVAEAKTLAQSHGVKWTGVYIGGACNGGSGWTESRVSAIHNATGWQFMPIWVGQQSPGICGAHALTAARGTLDGRETVARMKEFGWLPNRDIPVALDVEAGTYAYSAHGSEAYVRAWVAAVHQGGFRAYVYSSPSGTVAFHDARLGVDGAWVASYFYNGFAGVVPSDLHQIGSRYSHTNRAWQYAGDFEVSGVGRVDADTSDLLLAPAPHGTNRITTATPHRAATCGTLAAGEGLMPGESISACGGGGATLALTLAGDLQLRVDGAVTWSSGTAGVGATAVLGTDGDLVVYDADQEIVYDADTGGNPDARIELGATARMVTDDGLALEAFVP